MNYTAVTRHLLSSVFIREKEPNMHAENFSSSTTSALMCQGRNGLFGASRLGAVARCAMGDGRQNFVTKRR